MVFSRSFEHSGLIFTFDNNYQQQNLRKLFAIRFTVFGYYLIW